MSAIIWIGGMIVMRLSVMPSLALIQDENIKIPRTINIFQSFFKLVSISIVLLLITAIIMSIGMGFAQSDLYFVVHIKEGLWLVMTLVFIFAYLAINKAQNSFISGDIKSAKKNIAKVKLAVLINLPLGIIALAAGITLRGF